MGLVLLLAFLSAIAGGLYTQDWKGFAVGLLSGGLFGLWVWVNHVASILFPESFISYASETPAPPVIRDQTVMSVSIPELGARQIRGLTQDEWRRLGSGVVERGYRYTTRDLQDIFGAAEGNRIYGRITQQLVDAGILVPSGSNGVAVTEHVGRHFFERIHKQDYKVIDLIPHPAPESV